jgi:small Trp-rich protein
MWLLMVSVAVLALRYFEVSWFAMLSWWWVAGLFALTFLWFEFAERWLGLENKRATSEFETAKKRRIARSLEQEKNRGRPRG